MFLINGKPLQIDTPFTDAEGNSYPSNWIRFATAEDKARVGITEVADEVRADDRFYWNGDINTPKELEDREESDESGNPLYVQKWNPEIEEMENTTKRLVTKGLKSAFTSQVRQTAYSILLQSDWVVVRKSERNIDIPQDIADYRASILAKLNELELAINAVSSVEELASLNLSFPSED